MSNLVSALPGAQYDGKTSVAELGLQGMISLRGALSSAPFKKALSSSGITTPRKLQVKQGKAGTALWFSPDELLILCDYDKAPELRAELASALADHHHLAANMSDARALFSVSGNWDGVIARLSPMDRREFGPSSVRRTRLAQAPAALWRDEDQLRVLCFRSVATYVFELLRNAAQDAQ